MNLIELHILQSFPVSCLNRDDVGAPKSAYFGGCQRARVSSQSWKRAIRNLAKDESPNMFAGERSRFLIRSLELLFQAKDLTTSTARKAAIILADSLGKLDDPEKGNVKTLLYFSPMELEAVVGSFLDHDILEILSALADETTNAKEKDKLTKELKKLSDKAAKSLKSKVKDNADIAIFGRMVADDHSLMLEGAGMFSHALSTHAVANEIDFFSAVDDNNTSDDEGAGHIGTIEYNSACYYRYVGLNLDLLKADSHLAHFTDEELQQVISIFIKSAIMAVPGARKNSMFAFNPPAYVLGLKRAGQPLSLANAFEKPVYSRKGYVESSIVNLEAHWENLANTYGLTESVKGSAKLPESSLRQFVATLMD